MMVGSFNLLMDTTFAARSRMVKKVLNQVILSELSFYIWRHMLEYAKQTPEYAVA
jgi:hypothetical protein